MKPPPLWLLPAVIASLVISTPFVLSLLTSHDITMPQAPEKPRLIEQYTIDTLQGSIAVTEIRSGTEFNRLLQMPDGWTKAEAGYVISWGERKINLIGSTETK
jgi:hypothetical protein